MHRFDFATDRLVCPKCDREIPLPAASDFGSAAKRTCKCGVTARLQLKSAVDKMLQMGFSWSSLAEDGKRIIPPTGLVVSGGKDYLMFQEPVGSND